MGGGNAVRAPTLKTESLPQARRRRIRRASTSGWCAGARRCSSGPRPSALSSSQPLTLVEPNRRSVGYEQTERREEWGPTR